jgi:hypothetical protein
MTDGGTRQADPKSTLTAAPERDLDPDRDRD